MHIKQYKSVKTQQQQQPQRNNAGQKACLCIGKVWAGPRRGGPAGTLFRGLAATGAADTEGTSERLLLTSSE